MKNCPIARCRDKVPDRMFCCTRHWRSLPMGLKEEVTDAFNAYNEERISLAEFAEVQRLCLAAIGERVAEQLEEEAARAQIGSRCHWCKNVVARCFVAGETRFMDQVRNVADQRRLYIEGEPVFVIIGGDGVYDDPENDLPKCYARFRFHQCAAIERVAAAATAKAG